MDKAKGKVTGLHVKADKSVGDPKKAVTGLKMKSSTVSKLSGGKKTLKAKGK